LRASIPHRIDTGNSTLCAVDPYVKIWLLHDGKKVEKKKTPIKEKTLNPIFEETIAVIVIIIIIIIFLPRVVKIPGVKN